ncbi:hypothetical protein FRC02_007306, partial [Tulasnella sp. 418]
MLFAQVFHSVLIALCAILSSLPPHTFTRVVPSLCSAPFYYQHAFIPSPPPVCALPKSKAFPEPALIGLIMKGRYLWKGTEFVAPTSRVVDLSNVWLSDDIGEGARLFGITDNDSSWSSLNMRDLSCVWLLLTLLLVTAFADKSSVTTTIDPIAEGGALVHSGLPHYQLDNTTRQLLN